MDTFLKDNEITKENNLRLYNVFKQIKRPIDELDYENADREDFIDFFIQLNAKSSGYFSVLKSYTKKYFEWLMDRGMLSEHQLKVFQNIKYNDIKNDDSFKKEYFKDLNHLIQEIDVMIESLSDAAFKHKYDTFKCALVLCWCGIKPSEIVNVLKVDVVDDGIIYNEQFYPIHNKEVMEFLKRYRDDESYIADYFGRETKIYYQDGERLLRSKNNGELTYVQIRESTSAINVRYGVRQLSIGKAYESGVFYRMYEDEKINGGFQPSDRERLVKFFNTTLTPGMTSQKIHQYNKWKMVFYK